MSDLFIKRAKPDLIKSGELVILGNGPSLTSSINKNPEFLKNKDLVCVNFFPETIYFKMLKPGYYVTSTPELWIKNVSEEWRVRREKLFQIIRDETSWDIIFLIPSLARKHKHWSSILSMNPKIKITYYNITPIEGFTWFKHFCFKYGLGTPRAHNVLTPTLIQMLNYGYLKLYLLGADHSWLQEIKVDNENRVLIRQQHFYDYESATYRQMGTIKMGVRKLHEVIHKFYHTFAGYFIIREYASSLGATILNATPGSFIDAFERITIEK